MMTINTLRAGAAGATCLVPPRRGTDRFAACAVSHHGFVRTSHMPVVEIRAIGGAVGMCRPRTGTGWAMVRLVPPPPTFPVERTGIRVYRSGIHQKNP